MDWTEAEARLATLEREVTRHQRLAREQQVLSRDDGRVPAVGCGPAVTRGPGRGRWFGLRLGLGLGRWRRLPAPAAPAAALGALRAIAARMA
jgi:hypothetical protein